MYRTGIKKVESAVSAGDRDAANAALIAAIPIIDRMVNKGILHKAQAARYKSRLNASVKALS
jgi:small subunit ribosomal protein S20|tara:strand:+ start:242 stop:427 length:186 start_codon:yes stop_codon:yes gene_type:complete